MTVDARRKVTHTTPVHQRFWVYAGMALALLGAACGETRTLELFVKKGAAPNKPAPDPGCEATGMCPSTEPPCATCETCSTDAECPGGHVCVDAQCVECRSDEQCPMKKVCNTHTSRCTEPCTAEDECKHMERAVCDPSRGWCVQCTDDTPCPEERSCDTTRGECMGCTGDASCGDAAQ